MEQERIISTIETPDLNPALRGGPTTEYAKVVKISAPVAIKSIEADLQLPTSKRSDFKQGFINFYLGLGQAEAGISTEEIRSGWHWFANGEGGEGSPSHDPDFTEYKYGQKHHLRLTLVGNYLEFYVDGVRKHKYTVTTSTNNLKNGRLIFGAGRALSNEDANAIKQPGANTSAILGAFKAFHDQAYFQNIKYTDMSGTVYTVKSEGTTAGKVKIENMKWPLVNGSEVPCPAPYKYNLDASKIGNSIIYASLKK